MKIILLGILVGAALSFIPICNNIQQSVVRPEWTLNVDNIQNINNSKNPDLNNNVLIPVKEDKRLTVLKADGSVAGVVNYFNEDLYSVSHSGLYIASYNKTGMEINYSDYKGNKFWKMETMQYPYVSSNGNYLLFSVSDLSRISIVDKNSTLLSEISGRFSTDVFTSQTGDSSAVGFLDSSFHVINSKGVVVYSSNTDKGTIVKSIAVSPSAAFVLVHFGTTTMDYFSVTDINNDKKYIYQLDKSYKHKIGLNVDDSGSAMLVTEKNLVLYEFRDKPEVMPIKKNIGGYSSVKFNQNWWIVSYPAEDGGNVIVLQDKNIFLSKVFPDCKFVETFIDDQVFVMRAMSDLYCWSYYDSRLINDD